MISEKIIEQFIVNKQGWIVDKLSKVCELQNQRLNRDISILGKDYKIKVIKLGERKVYVDNNYIVFQIKAADDYSDFIRIYNQWYNKLSEEVIKNQNRYIYEKIAESGVPLADIKIRSMKSRWGSCYYNKNLIILNRHLIQLPKELINHVILHEYAHFIYHNHGKEFKNYLQRVEENSNYLEKLARHKRHDQVNLNEVFTRKDDCK